MNQSLALKAHTINKKKQPLLKIVWIVLLVPLVTQQVLQILVENFVHQAITVPKEQFHQLAVLLVLSVQIKVHLYMIRENQLHTILMLYQQLLLAINVSRDIIAQPQQQLYLSSVQEATIV